MQALAGQDLTGYFPPPLTLACPDLVTDENAKLQYRNFTAEFPGAVHIFRLPATLSEFGATGSPVVCQAVLTNDEAMAQRSPCLFTKGDSYSRGERIQVSRGELLKVLSTEL